MRDCALWTVLPGAGPSPAAMPAALAAGPGGRAAASRMDHAVWAAWRAGGAHGGAAGWTAISDSVRGTLNINFVLNRYKYTSTVELRNHARGCSHGAFR